MKRLLMVLIGVGLLGACTHKSAYEAAVENHEPVYCYKSLAGVACHEKPNFRDENRLVNYFGPAPKRYERPFLMSEQKLFAPASINYWAKDPEPLPRAKPHGNLADRPWIDKAPRYGEEGSRRTFRERGVPAGTRQVDEGYASAGTNALLGAIEKRTKSAE